MDFAIFWIFCLLSFLLTVAFFLGLAAGFEKKLWRYLVFGIPAGIILFFLGGITVLLGFVRANNIQPLWLFPYSLSFTLFFFGGVIIMFRWGMKREGAAHSADKWPKARLAFLSGLLACLTIGVFLYMDLIVLIELSKIKAESTVKAQNQLSPRLPDHLNAAGLYERAGEEIKIKKGEKRPQWFYSSEPAAFEPLSGEALELQERYRPALTLVRKSSVLPGYYFEVDIINLLRSPIPNYIKFRDISKLLVLSAQQKVLNGDTDGALAELRVVKEMARHLRSTPTIIAAMIAGVLDQLYSAGMEYVLAHAETIPASLTVEQAVSIGGMRPFIHRSFEMESMFGLQILSTLDHSAEEGPSFGDDDPGMVLLKLLGLRFWRVFFAKAEIASHRKFWEGMLERIDMPPEKQKIGWQDWMTDWEAKPKGLLISRFLPYFSQYVIKARKYLAMCRLTDMALAAAAFHRDFGRYPSSPEELIPAYLEAVPVDPFDGKPLRLKPLTGGMDLFSVGPEKRDVGGTSELLGPIHFYLGREAYEKYRLVPIRAQEAKKAQKKKKK